MIETDPSGVLNVKQVFLHKNFVYPFNNTDWSRTQCIYIIIKIAADVKRQTDPSFTKYVEFQRKQKQPDTPTTNRLRRKRTIGHAMRAVTGKVCN